MIFWCTMIYIPQMAQYYHLFQNSCICISHISFIDLFRDSFSSTEHLYDTRHNNHILEHYYFPLSHILYIYIYIYIIIMHTLYIYIFHSLKDIYVCLISHIFTNDGSRLLHWPLFQVIYNNSVCLYYLYYLYYLYCLYYLYYLYCLYYLVYDI